jgi:Leucine-rich repeat (LRR) protein
MTHSWELDLNLSRITDAELKHLRGLRGLRHLDLGRTYITDAGLVHLDGLTGLDVLRLDQTRVTAAGVTDLQRALPDTHISPSPRHLAAIAEIERLGGEVSLYPHPAVAVEFFHTPPHDDVTDAVLTHVVQLADLRKWVCLDLSETAITDAGLKQLKEVTNLLELDLSHTQITDAGLMHVKGLPDLTRLSLRGTDVTDAGLEHLEALTPLGRQSTRGWPASGSLNLIDTHVTGERVRRLQERMPNCHIEH